MGEACSGVKLPQIMDGVNPDLVGRGRVFLGCWQSSSERVWAGGRVIIRD